MRGFLRRPARGGRVSSLRWAHGRAQAGSWLPGLLGLAATGLATWVVAATSIKPASIMYLLYVGISLALGAIGGTTLVWMLYAWRTPRSLTDSRLVRDDRGPAHTFSLIVPARHEQAVLEVTLERLVQSDHPAFEVIVVVGDDDPATHRVAERVAGRHRERVRVIVDSSRPKNKPRALNAALPSCTGTITGVFDAEDDVHPGLLRRVDQCFARTDADIVQAGVQLMNFRTSWLSVHNVLEYYFWFRSRLHHHARQRFIPLGGNTVFVRTPVLRAVDGWDPDCLAEDCELGVRLSSLGARTAIFYEPELVTREECPPTLSAFVRQRTRWNQGYLQTLSRGHWRRLPLRQRAIGRYILAMPFAMAIAWLMIPVAIGTAIGLKAPITVTLVSFLPLLPMVCMLMADVAGLGEFCREYGKRPSARDYGRLILGLPLYQAVLTFAAARAVVRQVRGVGNWEKTVHLGLHLGQHTRPPAPATRRAPGLARENAAVNDARAADGEANQASTVTARQAAPVMVMGLSRSPGAAEPVLAAGRGSQIAGPRGTSTIPHGNGHGGAGNGSGRWQDRPASGPDGAGRPDALWARLDGIGPDGEAQPSRGALRQVTRAVLARRGDAPRPPRTQRGRGLARLRDLRQMNLASHASLALPLAVIAVVAVATAINALHWPATQFDEGTYVGDAWAVQYGRLAPYTYSYGHPPLAWLLIALWSWVGGLFGHGSYSIDTGRELMVAVNAISCSLLYVLARRLGLGRPAACAAVLAFGLSPVAVFFHRAVLLDNPSIAWTIAAFALAWTPRHRLWAFAGSGACFAAGVLSKETTITLLPALLVAVAQNADRRTRRYCLPLFGSSFVLLGGFYPLYATLKGELFPGPGHVSLVGYLAVQVLSRKGTGALFDPRSQTHAIVAAWLHLDPWLAGIALALVPVALARRTTRAIAFAYLIQVLTLFRPGYLPNMYVIGVLPFAALIVPGSIEAVWRGARGLRPGALAWSARFAISALTVLAVLTVAPRWWQTDHAALTARLDGPERAAEHWLVAHVSHSERLIVGDQYWIYLVEHGYDHHPMRGGFFSRTVVSYWPLDYDPAVKNAFPRGWRDFNVIVVTQAMLDTLNQTPTAAAAIAHSRLVVAFGRGLQQVQIRAIGGMRAGVAPPPASRIAKPGVGNAAIPGTYTVRPRDTLSAIAAKYRIRGGWRAVYLKNRAVIGGNPNRIRAGEHLIP